MKMKRVNENESHYGIREIKELMSLSGRDQEDCEEALDEFDGDMVKALTHLKHVDSSGKKKKVDKKIFKVGDVVTCINIDKKKLPPDCYEFLNTYKKFKVLDVNAKLNIDLGHRLETNGNVYYFSPNRFELLVGKAPTTAVAKEPSVKPLSEVQQKKLDDFSNFGKTSDTTSYGGYYDDDRLLHDEK